MKTKNKTAISSIGITAILLISLIAAFSLFAIPSIQAQAPETIEVSQPVQVTSNSYYERGESIVFDGSNYWMFYGRSASCTSPYQSGNPDTHDYEIYYKKATSIAGLTGALANSISGTSNGYLGELDAAYFNGKVWVFATIDVGPTATLYGWYTTDGISWTQSQIKTGLPDGAAHHAATTFNGELWIGYNTGTDWYTVSSSAPEIVDWSTLTPKNVGDPGTNGLAKFYIEGSNLYLAFAQNSVISICSYGGSSWSILDQKNIDTSVMHAYDPTLFKVNSNYVFAYAPLPADWSYQWIQAKVGTSLNNLLSSGTDKMITAGKYGTNTWTDMWPIGFTDASGDSYLFFTSERNPSDVTSEIAGNIWYLKVDWDVTRDHFTYIQEAIDAATGTTINVAAGTYNENVLVDKQLTLVGDPSTPSNVVVDALGTGTRPIKITADGCVLHGFKTINSESYYGSIGVWSNNNIIKDNIASDNSGSSGIFVYGSSYNTIENNNVSNNGNWGITLYSRWVGPGYIACENNTIKNNIANGNGQEGIGSGAYANNNTIEDNQVNGNTYAGIGLFRCSGNTIKDNTVNQNGAIGINIYGTSADPCTYHTITGNTVNNNGGNANIELGGYCHNNIVENNTANAGHYGICVSGDHNTVRKNTANGNSEDGMRLKGDNYAIENNTCNSNDHRGIWLGGGSTSVVNNAIVKNNILNDNYAGILLWTCHNSNLTGNTINNNTMYGIEVASNSPDNTIYCNNIVGNVNYGVKNEGTTEVNATCNWWGDTSGPSGVGPGTGDAVSTNVDFDPWIGITELSGPTDPVKLGDSVNISLSFTCNKGTATLDWGDETNLTYSTNSETKTESRTYLDAGVYTVTLTIEDCCGRSYSREFRYVVVYDPDGGFVTGGGWIDSPAGAYAANTNLTGKANFGFVSKYKKGQQTPTGNTQFQFKAGDLNFHSDNYDWLVIAGHKAMYKGTGTINGDGNYGFMLSAIDEKLAPSADVDMFRIKIWDKDNGDEIVYDNQMGDLDDADLTTEIAGGQIVIHKAK